MKAGGSRPGGDDPPGDLVVAATPIDLARVARIYHPVQRVRYELRVIGQPTLEEVVRAKIG